MLTKHTTVVNCWVCSKTCVYGDIRSINERVYRDARAYLQDYNEGRTHDNDKNTSNDILPETEEKLKVCTG